ncbi:S-adenosylmethionine decarboxylase [Tabrizicola sp. J26]|uniref:S-adenosylmethionine decarboxylase n=1 Tax=Alitabrizicola rongguiensis TaxID=2909234 RepID=UPI001F48F1CF|nr:S-adenosylmethionine decarboxylase [Tabrizicola rongguiensis]MCF1708427.1 S-adenosylmethionine decarboxylase [Tabrizicola rongguiensis]
MTLHTTPTEQFGLHLMIDGYDADPERLADAPLLEGLLVSLPDRLGMHRICTPVLVNVGPMNRKDPGGLSGFVMIAESHFSLHTFPARGFVTLDIYTCQNSLDTDAITGHLAEALGMSDFDVFVQPRGLRYPSQNLYPQDEPAWAESAMS